MTAALLVSLMCLSAIFYVGDKSKKVDIVTTRSEMRNVPHKATIIATVLPGTVDGAISPYPTVVIVIITHQIELKYGSIASKLESVVSILLKYGNSNILKMYDKIMIVELKMMKIVHSGLMLI